MRNTHEFFAHAKQWRLLAGAMLLLCLLFGLSLVARAASASPLPTYPTGTGNHVARHTDPPGSLGAQTPHNWEERDFAYVFNTGTQAVGRDQAVRFDTFPPVGGVLRGFDYNPGTGELTADQTGDFEVTFSVTNNLSNVFAIAVNGRPVPGTAYLSNSTLANIGTQNNGQAIIHLNARDKLTLQNRSGGTVTLVPLFNNGDVNTPRTVNASLLVEEVC